jgi:hypothetical protein
MYNLNNSGFIWLLPAYDMTYLSKQRESQKHLQLLSWHSHLINTRLKTSILFSPRRLWFWAIWSWLNRLNIYIFVLAFLAVSNRTYSSLTEYLDSAVIIKGQVHAPQCQIATPVIVFIELDGLKNAKYFP